MSPIAWDLGHIATFEDLWLAQNPFDRPPLRGDLGAVYDPFTAPRNERGALPYLRIDDALRHMEAVRERTLEPAGRRGPGRVRRCPARGRLRLRAGAAPRAAALRDDPPDAPDHDHGAVRAARAARSPRGRPDRGRDGVRAGRPVRDGRAGARLRVRQRAPASRERRRRVPDRSGAGDQRRHARVHRGRRLLRGRSCGATRAGHGASAKAWTCPATGSAASGELRGAFVRRRSSRSTPRSRCATCRGTRPTPTRAGRASACRPRPNGRRPPRGTPRAATAGHSPGATAPPTSGSRTSTSSPSAARPAGAYAAR